MITDTTTTTLTDVQIGDLIVELIRREPGGLAAWADIRRRLPGFPESDWSNAKILAALALDGRVDCLVVGVPFATFVGVPLINGSTALDRANCCSRSRCRHLH